MAVRSRTSVAQKDRQIEVVKAKILFSNASLETQFGILLILSHSGWWLAAMGRKKLIMIRFPASWVIPA